MVNAKGLTHTERFSLKNKDDEWNEGALNAFSYFAKTATQNWSGEDIAPEDLIDCYIKAEVIHTELPSKKDPNKTVTFANLGDKSPADGFDEEPVPKALTLGKSKAATSAPAPSPAPEKKSSGIDLASLLG